MKRLLVLLLLLLHLWAPARAYCWTDPTGVRHCSTQHHTHKVHR